MKKKISIIIAVIVIIALIAAAAIFHYLSNRTHFNEGYVNGNTAGNLYNGGLFCEYDGTVYFSNPSDGGKLYSMSPDGSNLAKLCDDTVSYINADEHYLYYVRNNPGATGAALSFLSVNTDSLCRIDREGGDDSVLILDSAPCLYASLYGNYIYYIRYDESEGSTLYNGKNRRFWLQAGRHRSRLYLLGKRRIYVLQRNRQRSLYLATQYHGRLKGHALRRELLYADCHRRYHRLFHGLRQQLRDRPHRSCHRREDASVRGPRGLVQPLRRLHLLPEKCSRASVSRFMRTDGSGYTTLFEGNFKDITITSEYVYFRDFSTDQSYCVPLGSSASRSPLSRVPSKTDTIRNCRNKHRPLSSDK